MIEGPILEDPPPGPRLTPGASQLRKQLHSESQRGYEITISTATIMSEETSEMPPPQPEEPLTKDQQVSIEREEEKKLKAKYPQVAPRGIGGRPPGVGPAPGPHSTFLQKRLAKGQKYFDSGDYQMAKQKNRLPGAGIPGTVVAPAPAASMAGAPGVLGSVAASSGGGPSRLTIPTGLGQPPPATGDTIPTPELVPMRKTSIIQPLHDHSTSMHLASDPAHVEPGRPLLNPAVAKLSS